MLEFAGGHAFMLFECAYQALGVPKADLLGSRFYRFGAQQFFGGVYSQALDILQNVAAGVFFESTGEIGAAHRERGSNRSGGQIIFGVVGQNVLAYLLETAGTCGGVLIFFILCQLGQNVCKLLFEI